MGLTESKGNMYSWVTHTWNTVKGECPHGCTYCYMKRWGKQKAVRFDEKELNTDLGSGNFIFVGSSCDLFAEGISRVWITDTLVKADFYTGNNYLFQSKNPERFREFKNYLPDGKRTRLCTTIETNRIYSEIMGNTPSPFNRALAMNQFIEYPLFVTIEPIMDFDLDEMVRIIKLCHPNQVNIGADSGNNNLPEPSRDKLIALINELKQFTYIDKKSNLKRILGE
jgi:DNA repair photolyase